MDAPEAIPRNSFSGGAPSGSADTPLVSASHGRAPAPAASLKGDHGSKGGASKVGLSGLGEVRFMSASCIGEHLLLGRRRTATHVAATRCDFLTLCKADLEELFQVGWLGWVGPNEPH